MYLEPPQGSSIKLIQDGVERIIKIPHGSGGIMKYFAALFILFWLGGWYSGFIHAWDEVSSGKGGAFLLFWLGGWTIGGLFVVYFLYKIIRPSVDETFRLGTNSVYYDSGIAPFQFDFKNQKEMKSLFAKRIQHEWSKPTLGTLALRETDSGNRLTIDHNAKRIDIGKSASEVEREWLYESLSKTYT